MTKLEKIQRLEELKKDRELARKAIRDIASGKKQSYGVGTRNAAAYGMTIGELRSWQKQLETEISELEAVLNGMGRRMRYKFIPRY